MSLYGNLRAATYVAKDVALALKSPGLLLANAAHLALNNTWESQACRVARGRDYNAAVDRAAAPVDVEELLAEVRRYWTRANLRPGPILDDAVGA